MFAGKKIPLNIQNDLLELISYEGLGNPLSNSPDTRDLYVQWPPNKSYTGREVAETKKKQGDGEG